MKDYIVEMKVELSSNLTLEDLQQRIVIGIQKYWINEIIGNKRNTISYKDIQVNEYTEFSIVEDERFTETNS